VDGFQRFVELRNSGEKKRHTSEPGLSPR
jgi:hypothetical protein